MLAAFEVPQIITGIAQLVGAFTVIVGGAGLMAKFRLTRFIGRKLVVEPFNAWHTRSVQEATADLKAIAQDAQHRIRYHLGSNDTTVPQHARLSRLEAHLGLDPVLQQPEPDLPVDTLT